MKTTVVLVVMLLALGMWAAPALAEDQIAGEQLIAGCQPLHDVELSEIRGKHLGLPHLALTSGANRGPCAGATCAPPRLVGGPYISQAIYQSINQTRPDTASPNSPCHGNFILPAMPDWLRPHLQQLGMTPYPGTG